jgi:thiosulfate/3-mercaptopyruvate sulfurtransferase
MTSTISAMLAVLALRVAGGVPAPSARASQGSDVPVIVSTAWLASHLADPRVVVIAVGQDRSGYDSLHVRGARFLPYRAYTQNRDSLTSELPPLAALDSALESIGVSDSSRVVIYGGPIISARLFLALDVTGLRGRVGVLAGGLEQWRAEGRETATDAPPVRRGSLTLHSAPGIVDRKWVREHLADSRTQFADARMRRGYDLAHLPGATHLPFTAFVAAGRTREEWSVVSRDSLEKVLASAAIDRSKPVVAYCAIGETASMLYLVLRSAGLDVRHYDGSMEDWQRDPSAPVNRSTPE